MPRSQAACFELWPRRRRARWHAARHGASGEEVTAFADEAVIFVEVSYDYQPLIGDTFALTEELSATASFTVRDDRDLSQIYQRDPARPDPIAACGEYGGSILSGG
jgi:hypothetical protein